MKVPRFFFRNVRSEPRRFQFRSPYYRPEEEQIEERKKRLDAEIARERGEDVQAVPERIRFSSRRMKRSDANLWATFRTIVILVILIYLLYKGLQWAETTNFKKVLDTFKNG